MQIARTRRITLIELAVLVVVVGLVALVGVDWYYEHQPKAKTAEAVLMIDKMWEGAHSYFDQQLTCRGPCFNWMGALPQDVGWTPPLGTCGSSGCKYGENASLKDFKGEAAWVALDFYVTEEPFYYSYKFESCEIGIIYSFWDPELVKERNLESEIVRLKATGKKGGMSCIENSTMSCQASGDLDGDGKYSLFKRDGRVIQTQDVGLSIEGTALIIKRDPLE